MPFHWSETHQAAFEQIKELLIKPPILHLPRPGGRFILYCDTSKTHTGNSLWQIKMVNPDFWDMLVKVCQKHVRITV